MAGTRSLSRSRVARCPLFHPREQFRRIVHDKFSPLPTYVATSHVLHAVPRRTRPNQALLGVLSGSSLLILRSTMFSWTGWVVTGGDYFCVCFCKSENPSFRFTLHIGAECRRWYFGVLIAALFYCGPINGTG